MDFYYLCSACLLVERNDVDLWIFENQKFKIRKVKVTVRKTLWIFIMDLSTACLGFETLIVQIDVDLWIFEFITSYLKNSKLPHTKPSGFVDFHDL